MLGSSSSLFSAIHATDTTFSSFAVSKTLTPEAVLDCLEIPDTGHLIALPVEVDENGVPKNYAQVILNGGGGGDPTDTLVVMVDDSSDPPKCAINHTSNKMTTSDIQSNSSPVQTVKNNSNAAKKGLREEDHEKADKLQEETLAEIEKQRVAQIKYIRNYASRLEKFANDDDKARKYIEIRKNNDIKALKKLEKDMKKFSELFGEVREKRNTENTNN